LLILLATFSSYRRRYSLPTLLEEVAAAVVEKMVFVYCQTS